MNPPRQQRPKHGAVRRMTVQTLMGVVFMVALVVVSMLLPPVRAMLLTAGISAANRSLPGTLDVDNARWPQLGTVELSGVRWVDGIDSLVVADRIDIAVKLRSLIRRDIDVDRVTVTNAWVSIPHILDRFSGSEVPAELSDGAADGTADGGGGFPRQGNLPGVPSIAVRNLAVSARVVGLSDSLVLHDVVVVAAANLLAGASAQLDVKRVEAVSSDQSWSVNELALAVDLQRGLFSGGGRGSIADEVPIAIVLTSAVRDSFALLVEAGSDSIEPVAVDVQGKVARDNLDVHAINAAIDLRVPGTRVFAEGQGIGDFVNKVSDLGGVQLGVSGELRLAPFGFNAHLQAHPGAWLHELRGDVAGDHGDLSIENYALRMPGLSMIGELERNGPDIRLTSSTLVEDSRWLAIVAPDLSLPTPFAGTLNITAAGPLDALTVGVDAAAEVGGFKLDRMGVNGDFAFNDAMAANVRIALTTLGLDVDVRAEVERSEDIVVGLSPIVIRESGRPGTIESPRSVMRYTRARDIVVDRLRIVGTAGDIEVSAALDSTLSGSARLTAQWPEVPTALMALTGIDPDSLTGIDGTWLLDGPYRFEMDAQFDEGGGSTVGHANFVLPGPRNVSPLLPDSMSVAGLGPLAGSADVVVLTSANNKRVEVDLTLDDTAWIDSSHVNVAFESGVLHVDSLLLSALQMTVRADGTVSDSYNLDASLELAGTDSIATLFNGLPKASMQVVATIAGPIEAPRIGADLNASALGDRYSVPRVTGRVAVQKGSVRVDVAAPQGMRLHDMNFSRVKLNAASVGLTESALPLRVELDVEGDQFEWFNSLVVDTTDGVRVEVDTLDVVIAGRDLRSRGRFALGTRRSNGIVFVDGLDLRGQLGGLRAQGYASADSAAMTAAIDLSLPPAPPALGIPAVAWPDQLFLDLVIPSPTEISAELELRGFVVGDGRRPSLSVNAVSRNDSLNLVVAMVDSASTYLDADVAVPMTIVAYPPNVRFKPGDLDIDLKLQDFPLVVFALDVIETGAEAPASEVAHIDGHLRLRGPTTRPHGEASMSMSFPDWPKLAAYRVVLKGALVDGAGGRNAAVVDSGIEASLLLTRSDNQVLKAALRYKAGVSLLPFEFNAVPEGFGFEVKSDSLMLAEFDPLLPIDVSLGGTLSLNLKGIGDIRDPELSGKLKARRLMVAVAQRARATANANIDLSGPLSAPKVEGSVDIIQGVIRIPDLPPNLHPEQGESLLLGDSLNGKATGSGPKATARPADTTRPRVNPQFDVAVKIPGGFFIRGKGLDLELGGELRLLKVDDAPEVIGELRAVRARLDMLGRRLTLDEGSVSFKGGDEINPELSVTLETQIEDTRVRILFGGTAQEPKVFFSSEPELEEGDIMALLLFGRPLNELDDDQSNHMQRRTAEVVMALGAAQLQEQTSQIGVDVITFKAGDKEDSLGAFSFGRYLNPQVLVSYVRSLDDADDSYVSLEYFLRGRFKIQSVYGRRQSGVGIGWGKDY